MRNPFGQRVFLEGALEGGKVQDGDMDRLQLQAEESEMNYSCWVCGTVRYRRVERSPAAMGTSSPPPYPASTGEERSLGVVQMVERRTLGERPRAGVRRYRTRTTHAAGDRRRRTHHRHTKRERTVGIVVGTVVVVGSLLLRLLLLPAAQPSGGRTKDSL